MKSHPILFSGPMVRAILAGRKTQTRRVITPQPEPWPSNPSFLLWKDRGPLTLSHFYPYCPYGVPGDQLWVRETWRRADGGSFYYRADVDQDPAAGWEPSIFMPRRACRLRLEVEAVRVERLWAITEEDAQAEGMTTEPRPGKVNGKPATLCPMTHRMAFGWGWDGINGKRAPWASNPWVWVVTFRRAA